MPQAVRAHARVTTNSSNPTTSFATQLSISAAAMSTAGFAPNDDVYAQYVVNTEVDDNQNHIEVQFTYDGTALGEAPVRIDPGNASRQSTHRWWTRVDLGATIGDFDVDIRSVDDPGTAELNKVEITIVRFADLGVEGTDWFYNQSIITETHTADYADADEGASITFTPGSVEDWVVLSAMQQTGNSVSRRAQGRVNLDAGTILSGEWEEEWEATTEEHRNMSASMISALAASEHTVEIEYQDDATAQASVHRSSELLIFRRDVWTDIYFAEITTTTIISRTNVDLLTLTDTLSVAQDMILFAECSLEVDANHRVSNISILDDTTTLEPAIQNGSGFRSSRSYDALDIKHTPTVSFANLSGTLDLTLRVRSDSLVTEDINHILFLAWGMELAELAVVRPPFKRQPNILARM